VKLDEYIQQTKTEKVPVTIKPEIIDAIADRVAVDPTFKYIKSANSLRNYIRTFCIDIVTLEQVNVAADLIYYKQKELHESGVFQAKEALSIPKSSEPWILEHEFTDPTFFQRIMKHLERRIPNKLKRKSKMLEAFRRKAQFEGHDDVMKETGISHGSVTDYIVEIQTYYLGDAGEDAMDEWLTELQIHHLTQGKNSDKPDHTIFDLDDKTIEIWSQKTQLDFDLYKCTHNVSPNEFAAAEVNKCPLFLPAYECRGFKWRILRFAPGPETGQKVNSILMTSPSPLGGATGSQGAARVPAADGGAAGRGEVNTEPPVRTKRQKRRR